MKILSKGIDISRWQGNFNMQAAVREGIKFAIIKGGGGDDGLYIDRQFENNYAKAKAANIPVGVYWFSKALNTNEAIKEADYFYNKILNGKKFELPVFIDVEHKQQLAVGKRGVTEIIKAWCSHLEKLGYWVGIYSSKAYFNSYMYDNELTCYAHWVAQWAKSCTYSNKSCLGVWQFGGETNLICSNKVAGVVCDQNYLLVDYPTLIKKAGLNGYGNKAVEIAPQKKSIDEVARDVIAGKYGNGATRKSKIIAEGYNYSAVQARVNELMK